MTGRRSTLGEENLDRMHAVDRAWNDRRWNDYAALFDPDVVVWASGDDFSHGRDTHVAKARALCQAFPDARVVADPTSPCSPRPTGPRLSRSPA